ncbi:hypothetical protein NQ318_004845 [Aromia moschata]|uniref:Transporter n=1 Tax=Aromia moschata TaxID=1265417 RepID=A0AAV8Z1S8_9CUCU|nr:hypothetical protein NQ318_004845 [Aromia moschata]
MLDSPTINKNGLDNPAFESGPNDLEKGSAELQAEKKGEEEDDENDRATWGNSIEFLMSCIAMSVGLGNIWRFPFIANRNGGGAFLIPYIIVLTVIGRPMYYMEMALGQFSSRGNVKMYEKLSPVLKAIGYGQLIGSTSVATYYCCLMAITLFYFINSFTNDFPWATCQDTWDDYLKSRGLQCIDATNTSKDRPDSGLISSSEMYFKREVLKEIDDISDGIGLPEWRLTCLLLLSWFITFLVSIRGVKSSGKASYFLALFPYVIMITLLIRASTLPGAGQGMYYFIETDWSRLLQADVWYAAVTQCFFSLNVGFGSIIMYSSYNSFTQNINRDALVVTTLDTFTSLLSGVTIFGILGNLAYEMGVDPSEVLAGGGGTGLAFISYPDAISKFNNVPWLFAILFFFMLFVLGVGSLVALQCTLNTAISDAFPNVKTWIISAFTAIAMFLVGLMYMTPGGQYMLDLVDHFGGTFIIFVFAILEVTAVTWLYGIDNFCLDLEFMTKKKVGIYWRVCWGVLMPILLVVIFIYFVATLEPLQYGIDNLYYPDGIIAIGWCILGAGVLQLCYWLIYYFWKYRSYFPKEIFCKMFSTETWGPQGQKRTEQWRKWKEDVFSRRPNDNTNIFKQKGKILIGKY